MGKNEKLKVLRNQLANLSKGAREKVHPEPYSSIEATQLMGRVLGVSGYTLDQDLSNALRKYYED